jgi:nickel superoxide dismutase
MSMLTRLLSAVDRISDPKTVHAHCDIPCGVYDPEQARIEAESCYKMIQKYHDSDDEVFRARCIGVKEERADLAKHHIYVLWSDYFKPPHVEKFPDLHDVCWQAAKQCSEVKHTMDLDAAQKLLDLIDQIEEMWKATDGLANTRKDGRPSA